MDNIQEQKANPFFFSVPAVAEEFSVKADKLKLAVCSFGSCEISSRMFLHFRVIFFGAEINSLTGR